MLGFYVGVVRNTIQPLEARDTHDAAYVYLCAEAAGIEQAVCLLFAIAAGKIVTTTLELLRPASLCMAKDLL